MMAAGVDVSVNANVNASTSKHKFTRNKPAAGSGLFPARLIQGSINEHILPALYI
jgi:hypothetical protein